MKISELPQEIKELALKNIKFKLTNIEEQDLISAFSWQDSKEGNAFWNEWNDWDKKPIKLGDCLKLENRIIYLELKIEELINTLKTN
jgi:hypothetical protein